MKKRKFKRPRRFEFLSRAEIRIMRLKGMGYSNYEIAIKLNFAEKTIETYRTRTVHKLGIDSATYRKLAFKLAAGLIQDF